MEEVEYIVVSIIKTQKDSKDLFGSEKNVRKIIYHLASRDPDNNTKILINTDENSSFSLSMHDTVLISISAKQTKLVDEGGIPVPQLENSDIFMER